MKKIFSLLFFITVAAEAQKITLSGYVSDAKTKERLIGANVFIAKLNIATQTNNFGFYSITCLKQNIPIEITTSYVGYQKHIESILLSKSSTKDFMLNASLELQEVVVKSSKYEKIQNNAQMSSIEMPMETIKKLPALLGEVDIMKSLQLLPGIQAGNEGQNGLYVRGGTPDQNLILLDGVPVYNANHLFGFLSVFNSDAISNVEVYKGGFPARYGGRLSSVIDLHMKEGDKSGVHGNVGIGLIASRLMLEGPIGKKQKGSWLISGRRTFLDLFMTPIVKAQNDGASTNGYYFWDLNAKANYTLGKNDRLYLSAYAGNDKFFSKDFDDNKNEIFNANINWGNITTMVRWNHQFSPKTFGNLTGSSSRYQFSLISKMKSDKNDYLSFYNSKIADLALKYDIDFIPSPKHYIKLGFGMTHHTFRPSANTTTGTETEIKNDSIQVIKSPEFDAYIEDELEISSRLKANIGVHFSAFKTANNFYHYVQPRFSARYLLSSNWSLKASYAQMSQYIHLLTNSTVGLPSDLWVPVTDKIKPQQSSQIAFGVANTFRGDYEMSIEAFYKKMDNLIDYKEGTSYLNSKSSWEDKVEMGKGWSYGTEVFIQKKTGRLTGLVGYTLSWNNRKFPTINEGKEFPFKFDRRHDIKIAGVYKWKKNIELSADWVFGTGNSISVPIYSYSGGGPYDNANAPGVKPNTLYQYGDRNNYRMSAYHRMDLGISFIKKTKRNFLRTWTFSIYNVYSRANPYFVYPGVSSSGKNTLIQMSLFPIIPSVSYNLKF